jgi:hypothetical protein
MPFHGILLQPVEVVPHQSHQFVKQAILSVVLDHRQAFNAQVTS